MLEFSPDDEMRKIAGLANEFRKNILDNETFFVSDEANIFDVSGARSRRTHQKDFQLLR